MLVLSRKVGQAIYLGDDIKVVLVQIRGRAARVAIEAPAAIRIEREELREPHCERAMTPSTAASH